MIKAGGALLSFMLVGAALAAGTAGLHAARPATSRTVFISAKRPWTDTGVRVTRGHTFRVTATGSVAWQPGRRKVAPDGLRFVNYVCASAQYGKFPFEARGLNCWGLIGRIGTTDVPFPVGSRLTLKSPSSGKLYLGFNDNVYSDNSGGFTAHVSR